MWRFLAGVGSTLLLVSAGIMIWRGPATSVAALPTAPTQGQASDAPLGLADLAEPPTATEKTREQKRFARYDKDKNGAITREEYLTARRKAYAKLDSDGDGRLSFDEYAIKTARKFAAADRDGAGGLTPAEFVTTRVIRKAGRTNCPPQAKLRKASPAGASDGEGDAPEDS